MKILVQKYGGTSVGSPGGLRSLTNIVSKYRKTHKIVVVVSAVSSKTKAEGTTSLLLEACQLSIEGKDFGGALEMIRRQHLGLVKDTIRTPELGESLVKLIDERLEWTKSFLSALGVVGDISSRSRDAVASIGEQLSAHVVSTALQEDGIPAAVCDLSDTVPSSLSSLDHKFFKQLAKHLGSVCLPSEDLVPVVTGFFGSVPGGLLRQIGRGYSDLTAALVAAGFGAEAVEELQIWKEVDGVFSADPRRVSEARVVPLISAHEASELTYFGSEVLHPYTMEQVISVGIPIRVKNTHRPETPGTLIVPSLSRDEKCATAVTAKRGVSVCMVKSNRMYEATGFLAGVFNVMRDIDLSVDLVSTSEVSISFTVDDVSPLQQARVQLENFGEVTILERRAILSVVGEGLRGFAGAAGNLFTSLGEKGINVEMISQGISESNISCVIPESDIEAGLKAAHTAFFS